MAQQVVQYAQVPVPQRLRCKANGVTAVAEVEAGVLQQPLHDCRVPARARVHQGLIVLRRRFDVRASGQQQFHHRQVPFTCSGLNSVLFFARRVYSPNCEQELHYREGFEFDGMTECRNETGARNIRISEKQVHNLHMSIGYCYFERGIVVRSSLSNHAPILEQATHDVYASVRGCAVERMVESLLRWLGISTQPDIHVGHAAVARGINDTCWICSFLHEKSRRKQ